MGNVDESGGSAGKSTSSREEFAYQIGRAVKGVLVDVKLLAPDDYGSGAP